MPKEALLVSTVARVTGEISRMVMEGALKPGEKLNEVAFATKFDVSRNTLRESFRTLIRDGLLVHYINRGVYVKSFELDEVEKLYQFRRFMQLSCISFFEANAHCSSLADAMLLVATRAAEAADAGDWGGVAHHNNEFHLRIFDIPDNEQVREIGRDTVVQFRLVFMNAGQGPDVHGPFIERNKEIAEALVADDKDRARELLDDYLGRSLEVARARYR